MSHIPLLSSCRDRGDLELLLAVAAGDFQGRGFYHKASDFLALVGTKRGGENEADEDGQGQGSTKKVGHGGVPPGSVVDPVIRSQANWQELRLSGFYFRRAFL